MLIAKRVGKAHDKNDWTKDVFVTENPVFEKVVVVPVRRPFKKIFFFFFSNIFVNVKVETIYSRVIGTHLTIGIPFALIYSLTRVN